MPRIGNLVMQVLAQRVREADRKIGTLALMDVYGRVANTLLELSVINDGKLMVSEKLSQQELANMVGASIALSNASTTVGTATFSGSSPPAPDCQSISRPRWRRGSPAWSAIWSAPAC